MLLKQKYSSPTHTTYFHFNFLCTSNKIQYRRNASIKAQSSDIFQTILQFWPFKYDYRARDASSDHYHPQQALSNPTVKLWQQLNFSLGGEGNNISSEKSFGPTSWSTPNDTVHRLYQGLLYVQNVIQFQGSYINVISFMLIRKEQHLHDSFPQTQNVAWIQQSV